MGFFDVIGSVFRGITGVASAVAPYVLPTAALVGGIGLLTGNDKLASLGGGIAAGAAGAQLLGGLAGGFGGGASAPSAPGTSGVLGGAGVAGRGAIGTGTSAGAAGAGQARSGGILSGILGDISGSDLLKFGGQILAGLDTTEEDLARERLAIERERMERADERKTVHPVTWNATAGQVYNAVIARTNPQDITQRRII